MPAIGAALEIHYYPFFLANPVEANLDEDAWIIRIFEITRYFCFSIAKKIRGSLVLLDYRRHFLDVLLVGGLDYGLALFL